jgi:outer membrane protein OmpA-like peptidoglycan-associated protein
MNIKPRIISIVLTSAIAVGCANNKTLSQDEAFQAYPSLAKLQQQVNDATQTNLSILSPKAYLDAAAALEKAHKLAIKGKPDTQKVASQGLASLDLAIENSEKASDVFEEVIAQRQRTISAYGDTKRNASLQGAEKQFLELTTQFENKEYDEAKAGRAELIQKYADLELKAVKSNVLDQVKKEMAAAKSADLDDISPKTFKLAHEELELAISTLNVDRNNTQKAGEHASKALWHLNRAKQIDDMIKNFKTSNYSEEDKILWYQDQLDKVALMLNQVDLYDQPNKVVINTLASSAAELNTTINTLNQELAARGSQLTNIELSLKKEAEDLRSQSLVLKKEKDLQIQALRIAQEKEQKRQQAIANKFSEVQQLFDTSEAEVYRKVDDVLIRAHGFTFKPGNSEIDSANFSLLNKITEAISKFDNATVLVSGHTDSTGSDDINMSLSQQRAEKVSQFLAHVGRINPARIEHKGFGESRPVASNETDEGKASNRRVEILIRNSGLSKFN